MVTYWQTLYALLEICGLTLIINRALEILSLVSALSFVVYLQWGTATSVAWCALERVGHSGLWVLAAAGVAGFHVWAWRKDQIVKRITALGIAGVWWAVFSLVLLDRGGFLAVHITTPWLAVLCMGSALQLAVRNGNVPAPD
jgi:hypothetical protein